MRIHGWGCYPTIDAHVLQPISASDCARAIEGRSLIARGMGRSYGDSANSRTVLQTTYLDHYVSFDIDAGILTCESGLTIRELLGLIVPNKWFVPVTPGTSYVTVGGAIASDVHGKNHHIAGTFGQHVQSLTLLLGTGEVVSTSPIELPDLFHATCGGMGLTGIILSATIKLIPVTSSHIKKRTIKARCLKEICDKFEAHASSTYSVAWIDCMATGRQLGRAVLMLGEHAEDSALQMSHAPLTPIPTHLPEFILNKWSIKTLNNLYYAYAKRDTMQTVPFGPYFYPLDMLANWNRLYGKRGFVQYQFVLPLETAVKGLEAILAKIAANGAGSFLAVLKMLGPENKNLLSFPMEGYTLALDFPMSRETVSLLRVLDDIVVHLGGRIYLAKDALMTDKTFKATYPKWKEFEAVREKYSAFGKFCSAQSQRLGLR